MQIEKARATVDCELRFSDYPLAGEGDPIRTGLKVLQVETLSSYGRLWKRGIRTPGSYRSQLRLDVVRTGDGPVVHATGSLRHLQVPCATYSHLLQEGAVEGLGVGRCYSSSASSERVWHSDAGVRSQTCDDAGRVGLDRSVRRLRTPKPGR